MDPATAAETMTTAGSSTRTIRIPISPEPCPGHHEAGSSFRLRDAQDTVPDDRTVDDWQREQEERYTGFNFFDIYYRGYDQYGRNGEVTYNDGFSD